MALQNWQVDLREKGFVVIPDVLTPSECLCLENGFWNFWRRLSGGLLIKEDSRTWKTIYDFFPLHGMLSQHFSIGHMQVVDGIGRTGYTWTKVHIEMALNVCRLGSQQRT